MPKPYRGSVRSLTALTTSSANRRAYWSLGSFSSILELHRLGHASREVGSRAIRELKVLAVALGIELGVVLLDEAAGAADQIEPHQIAPVVGVLALLEGGQRPHRALVSPDELRLAEFAKELLGANADVLLLVDEQPQLVRQVQVGLVVWRGREQDHAAVVGGDVLRDGAIAPALAVAEVVALIDQHQPEATQIGKLRAAPG